LSIHGKALTIQQRFHLHATAHVYRRFHRNHLHDDAGDDDDDDDDMVVVVVVLEIH
jgi:hypothetical protein